jgi:hypothetical protein
MTNAQAGTVCGVKKRLDLISNPLISDEEKQTYRDWILHALESYIRDLNQYRLGCTCESCE